MKIRPNSSVLFVAIASCLISIGAVPKEETDDNRRVLFFGASWCPACQQIKQSEYPKLKEKHWKIGPSGAHHIQEIDSDKHPDVLEKYAVSSLPTFVLVVEGKEQDRHGKLSAGEISRLYYGKLEGQ